MRIKKLSLSGIERTKLFLGYVGENEHTQIRFDASCIYTDNPGARAGLTMQNPAGTVFPIVLDADGNEIIWNVSASDVAIAGNGSYQLTFTDNDEIIKTFIGQLFVLKSLTSAGDIPTPIDNWIDQANQKLAEVEAATESIDNMDASATKLSPDASPTVTVSDVDGHKHLAFGIPQGEKGDKGEKGDTYEVTPENIEEISSRVVQSATIAQYTEGMADQVEAAQQHAKDAGESATAADSSKKAAAQSAQAASQSATAADTSARNAAQSATNAGNSAQAADRSAQAASQSATNAAQSERNAADSAQDAQVVLDSIPADYSTLSTDVTNLKSAIADTAIAANTGDVDLNLVPNTYITGTGVEVYYAGWSSTDFISVIPNGLLHATAQQGLTYNAFYDENKTFISKFNVYKGQNDIAVPETAYFCRLSGETAKMQGVSIITDIKALQNANAKTAEFYHEIIENDVKTKNSNAYTGKPLAVGRVFRGVFDSSITTFKCTDYIQIIPGHEYAVYGGFFSEEYRYYFDRSKKVVGVLPFTDIKRTYPYTGSNNHLIFTAPDDAGFIRINFQSDSATGDVVPDGFYFVDITDSKTAKAKVLVIGDSISTDYYGGYKKWVTDLIDEGYFLRPNVSNNSIHATGFVARYSQTDDDTFLTRLRTYEQTNYDWVVIFGGINDFIQSIDYDAFKTAVDAFFQYLTANFYNKKLCVFSPLRTATTTANSAGHIQQDYADYIKSVAKNYAIPVLNLTEESGFFPFVEVFKDQWTLLPEGASVHDGVHPTEAWEKQYLVPIIKNFFRRFYV